MAFVPVAGHRDSESRLVLTATVSTARDSLTTENLPELWRPPWSSTIPSIAQERVPNEQVKRLVRYDVGTRDQSGSPPSQTSPERLGGSR